MRAELIELQTQIKNAGPIECSENYTRELWWRDLFDTDTYAKSHLNDMGGEFFIDLSFTPVGESIVKVQRSIMYSQYERRLGSRQRAHILTFAITPEVLKSALIVPLSEKDLSRKPTGNPTRLKLVFDQLISVHRHAEWPFTNYGNNVQEDFEIQLSEVMLWFVDESVARYAVGCFRQWNPEVLSAPTGRASQTDSFTPDRVDKSPTQPVAPGSIPRGGSEKKETPTPYVNLSPQPETITELVNRFNNSFSAITKNTVKAPLDISCMFLPTEGIIGRGPMNVKEEYASGSAIAVHNADYLTYETKSGKYLLHANFSELELPARHFSAWDHSLDSNGLKIQSTLDGLSSLRVDNHLIALKNVVQIGIHPPPEDSPLTKMFEEAAKSGDQFFVNQLNAIKNARLEVKFVSGNISIFILPSKDYHTPSRLLDTLPYLHFEPAIPLYVSFMWGSSWAFNTQSFVWINHQIDGAPNQSTSSSCWVQLLNNTSDSFDKFEKWMIEGPGEYPFLAVRSGWIRLDYAWSIHPAQRADRGQACFSPVVNRASEMPTAQPWQMNVPLNDTVTRYLKASNRWIESEGAWFNIARASSASRDGQHVQLSIHSNAPSLRVRADSLRNTPYGSRLLTALGL